MHSFKTKKSVLFAAVLASAALSGCYDNTPRYAQPVVQAQPQMTQQCGQSMQTGQTECILVPLGSANPYPYPAPRQYYSDNHIGFGTVVAVGALAGTAGYLAGRNQQTQQTQPSSNFYPGPGPIGTQYRQPGGPQVQQAANPQFKPVAAAQAATVKPMSIPPSLAKPATPAATTFTPARAAPLSTPSYAPSRPSTTFTPTRAAPSFSPTRSTSSFSSGRSTPSFSSARKR